MGKMKEVCGLIEIKMSNIEKLPVAYKQAYADGVEYFEFIGYGTPDKMNIKLDSVTMSDIKGDMVAEFKLTGYWKE